MLIESIEIQPQAYLLLGPPKCGKSAWAEAQSKCNGGIFNLNIDKFSNKEERSSVFERCLIKGTPFIYEGFALKDYRIEKLINKIKSNGYKITLVHFDAALNEGIKNISKIEEKISLIYDEFKDKVDEIIEVKNGVN